MTRQERERLGRKAEAISLGAVGLTGQLSNPQPALEALAELDIGTPTTPRGSLPEKAQPARRIPRAKSRTARPLKAAQVDALTAGYQAGRTMKELAAEVGINRLTVSAHLRRAGVRPRRGGLDQGQTIEAARLYEAGWSSGKLAERFNVSADNVLKGLRRAGVAIRPRRGGPTRNVAPNHVDLQFVARLTVRDTQCDTSATSSQVADLQGVAVQSPLGHDQAPAGQQLAAV